MLKTIVIMILLAANFVGVRTTTADGQDLDREALQGKWVLVAVDGIPITDRQPAYFEVRGDKIWGFDGCNMFGGSLDDLARIRATLRACADHAEYLDLRNLQSQLSGATVEGSVLKMPTCDGKAVLEFELE